MPFRDPISFLVLPPGAVPPTVGQSIILLDPGPPPILRFYTGDSDEAFPGSILTTLDGSRVALELQSPVHSGGADNSGLILASGSDGLPNVTRATLYGDIIRLSEQDAVNGFDVTLDATGIDIAGVLKFGNFFAAGPSFFAAGEEGWIAPTLLNSWVDYAAGWTAAGYRLDPDGYVTIRGLVKNGTLNTTIFTLPVGYRPPAHELFEVGMNANGRSRIDVNSNGNVSTSGATSNAYQGLSGIRFATF